MDGPSVNLKFKQKLVADRKHFEVDLHGILQLGTCSLRAIHEAFCTAIKDTRWDLKKLICAICYLFHDSPARHDDFQCTTQLDYKFFLQIG